MYAEGPPLLARRVVVAVASLGFCKREEVFYAVLVPNKSCRFSRSLGDSADAAYSTHQMRLSLLVDYLWSSL